MSTTEKPWTQRILRALRNEPRITGRYDLLKSCVPSGQWTLEDTADMNAAVASLIENGQILEQKVQIEGTGEEGPPVFEYVYSIVKDKLK
jgi:hypothetical protein